MISECVNCEHQNDRYKISNVELPDGDICPGLGEEYGLACFLFVINFYAGIRVFQKIDPLTAPLAECEHVKPAECDIQHVGIM